MNHLLDAYASRYRSLFRLATTGVEPMAALDQHGNTDGSAGKQPQHGEITNEVIDATVTGHVLQAGVIIGGVHDHADPQEFAVPRQLPMPPAGFVGRVDELSALTASLDKATDRGGTVVISALAGNGGIGKTSLALRWAHQHIDWFPDGQLFVDLQGFSAAGSPLDPASVVRGFLDAFGVDLNRISPDLHAQTARFRELVAGRRMLIVLDNAATGDQVVPL